MDENKSELARDRDPSRSPSPTMASALHEVLSGTLSADTTIRKTAEIELTRAIDNPG